RGLPALRYRRVDVASMEGPIWRHEGQRRQAPEGARDREPAPEEHRRRSHPGQRDAQRGRQGKLLTPNARRRAVTMLEESFGVKERRACRVVGQHRSAQRLQVTLPSDDEQELRRWLIAFAKAHPRWGWKQAYQHRRREGHRVNKKRIQRLWRLEGLKVPYRKRKKPLRGLGVHVGAMSPIRPNAIWAMDFQFDETRDGRQLKLLNIQDIFTRECLSVEVARSIAADDLLNVLDRLVAQHGVPAYLRCDNGPEFAA